MNSGRPDHSAENRLQTAPTPNFDRVARIYRWAEYLALGSLLQRTRVEFLPQIRAARHALVLGDGDGRFTAVLLRASPHIRVHAVDASASMLRLLSARAASLGATSRITAEQASVLAISAPADTDLIATHYLLDCLLHEEVTTLTSRLSTQVRPGCLWVLSDFGLPRNPLLRPFARAYIRLLYLGFRLLTGLRPQTLPDPQLALREAGFTRLRRVDRLGGFLYSELWQLPADLDAPAAGAQLPKQR